jgi:hypothetical protein
MEKTAAIFDEDTEKNIPSFCQKCIANKSSNISVDTITAKCKSYARLLGLLGVIWLSVRGIERGLLSTNTDIEHLRTALSKGKALWLEMGLTTNQPKWHYTFDGHLLYQVSRRRGLADKADDSIEKFHQTLKILRQRYRGTRSYKAKENSIRKQLRRQRSPRVERVIRQYEENKSRQSKDTKRKQKADERQTQEREPKKLNARL